MKMVIRADDAGYTHVHNIATFETTDRGFTTSVDLMLDTPGAVEAMEMLRERPWISVGWHPHFWGRPVLSPSAVPSLFDTARGHFRRDLLTADDISPDECRAEFRAELELCKLHMGRVPDTILIMARPGIFYSALAEICDEYGIVRDYLYARPLLSAGNASGTEGYLPPADPKWRDRNIYITNIDRDSDFMQCLRSDSLKRQAEYDPLDLWYKDACGLSRLPDNCTAIVVLHPGYVDHYVYREGDFSPQSLHFMTIRVLDTHALCSPALHDWLLEHRIELINQRDALYGTTEYQDHLRAVGSDLYIAH